MTIKQSASVRLPPSIQRRGRYFWNHLQHSTVDVFVFATHRPPLLACRTVNVFVR